MLLLLSSSEVRKAKVYSVPVPLFFLFQDVSHLFRFAGRHQLSYDSFTDFVVLEGWWLECRCYYIFSILFVLVHPLDFLVHLDSLYDKKQIKMAMGDSLLDSLKESKKF